MEPDNTPDSPTITTPPEAALDPAPVATAPDKPTRPWRGAPTRLTADGGTERYCRICRQWHPVAAFRPYVASGCVSTLCRPCERIGRRLRYLRDNEIERQRARDWDRRRRAAAKIQHPVATGEKVIDEADHSNKGAHTGT
ncbi:MAG: hypothetical protein K2X00_09850 [Nitrospiraceae bacterium]|nr:hypothetical protein [Nitrospiraceae bacterium]